MTVGSEQKAVSSEKTGEKPMTKSILFWLLATVLLTTAPPAEVQQPKKVSRIGSLAGTAVDFVVPLMNFLLVGPRLLPLELAAS